MAHSPSPASAQVCRYGVLADDLTGAGDTALQFHLGAADPDVWILPEIGEAASFLRDAGSAVAVNMASRHVLPGESAERVARATQLLKRLGCNQFYLKMDSTLRGNFAVEALRASQILGVDLVLVAPAFPGAGRSTIGGYQLVDGLPVHLSVYSRDPITPVTESHVPSLLSAQFGEVAVGHMSLRDVNGPEAVLGAIVRAVAGRKRVLVIDAARDEDLGAIARAMSLVPYRLLPVGSAGLAKAMQGQLVRPTKRPALPIIGGGAPVLVVSGSLNPVTQRQVAECGTDIEIVALDIRAFLLGDQNGWNRAMERATQLLLSRRDVILTTSLSERQVTEDRDLARDLALGTLHFGAHLADGVGAMVARLVAEADVSGLVLTGGDTALGICRALKCGPMKGIGGMVGAIPICRVELPTGPLRIVTKSGGFGTPNSLRELVRMLKSIETR